ncbi:hypothetical protein L798_08291 [Zootermopsis nevadensis]|uniref:Uncharacterized protein n=2 Tax=Zootermopsis nevadensis TaxID=136037 RepID=A0A067R2D9_ZOONE|nr:hypothetical protein L798_08291 [Zootermopsis nevadensis]
MPEEPSTVRPQEEPEIQLVSHVQEISSPKRSEEQLQLDIEMMMQKLRSLWDAGIQVTFGHICPPASTDRITAMTTFELLLHMHHLNIVLLRQSLRICPPTLPREPVIIHPGQ